MYTDSFAVHLLDSGLQALGVSTYISSSIVSLSNYPPASESDFRIRSHRSAPELSSVQKNI